MFLALPGASPADVYSDVVASGAWNRVRESSSSGSFNARVLDNTPNVLTQINLAPALVLTPDNLQVRKPKIYDIPSMAKPHHAWKVSGSLE